MAAPVDLDALAPRPGAGSFGAGRAEGKRHQGVDLMLVDYSRQCLGSTDGIKAATFHVHAIADGTVAYARANTAASCPPERPDCKLASTGLGLTIVIDHGTGVYSLYAHMAQDPATNRCLPESLLREGKTMRVKVGQRVTAGEVIGFLGQLGPGISEYGKPSGNAVATAEAVQLHFELFRAPPGRSSFSSIAAIVPAAERGKIDPNTFLARFQRRP